MCLRDLQSYNLKYLSGYVKLNNKSSTQLTNLVRSAGNMPRVCTQVYDQFQCS